MTLALLWQEGLEKQQWKCGYATFCRRYQKWQIASNLSMRQVYKGGEKLFVDYSGMSLSVVHPETKEVNCAQIFVACLGASNYTYAEATVSQELAYWIGSHERALAFFGGVPKCIVPDNLKSGVTTPCRYEPGVNRSYQEFAEHYGLVVIPARPGKPRDKAKVEKAVQEVERQVLAPLRDETFTSFTQLNTAIATGIEKLNQKVMKGYEMSRQELFAQVDKPALSSLPTQPFIFARWKQAKVGLDYHIEVEHHYYSVPYWFVNHEVRIKISEQLIEVFENGKRIACHERKRSSNHHTTLPEHLPPEHWAHKQQSRTTFVAWAEQIGTETVTQTEAIFADKAHEEQAFRSLRGLQRLAQKYGSASLEAACRRANRFGMVGMTRISTILESQLEHQPLPDESTTTPVVEHDNVRGSQYYC